MPTTPIHQDCHGYLQEARSQILRSVEGLDEYDLRRPMTSTGTNLLGVVKHLVGIEAGYLGLSLGHPIGFPLPWIDDEADTPNRDMWAASDESADHLINLYRDACRHSDAVIAAVGPESGATVPWWPEGQRETTAGALLARVLNDTATHAGQLQILRELIDGQAGPEQQALGDAGWWSSYVERLETLAQGFKA